MDPVLFDTVLKSRQKRLQQYIKNLSGLVAYYPLNETSGNAINRAPATFGTLNGTVNGVTQGVVGRIGKAYSFDGVDDFILLTQPISTSIYTYGLLVNTESYGGSPPAQNQSPFYCEVGGTIDHTKNYMYVNTSTRKVVLDQYTPLGGEVESSGTFSVSEWLFCVIVQTAANSRDLYVNGVFQGTGTDQYNGSAINNTTLGRRNNTGGADRFYKGLMQHFFQTSTALSASQILQLTKFVGLA